MVYGTSDHGFIPLGKYSSARDSILHYLVTSEWGNESGGDMDYGLWFSRISNAPEDVSMQNSEFNSVMDEWLEMNPEVTDSPELRSELVGHFAVEETEQGFVYVTEFSSESDLIAAFKRAEDAYNAWLDQDETE